MDKEKKHIPEPVLRRLPVYCNFLRRTLSDDAQTISCTDLGEALDLNPTQIRKDLAMAGAKGRPKVGYKVNELVACLEGFMGWSDSQDVFLVGTGHMGKALLGYNKAFDKYGIRIIAAFDNNPEIIGAQISGVEVYPITKFGTMAQKLGIKLAILTVPAEVAQRVANTMVASGIQAILNFAPVKLNIPQNVIVHNEELFASLGVLSSKLNVLLQNPSK